MSARGRHRRPRTQRLARAAAVLTAGGAGLALPLMGAGSANAASVDTWDKVAQCESTGDWSINTGNGYYGGLQFSQSTWEGYGGTEYAATADQATKEQQITIAEKVLAEQGPGAWPKCGPEAGLTQNSGDPGVNPDSGTEEQGSQDTADSGAQAEQPKAPEQPAEQPKAQAESDDSKGSSDSPSSDRYTVTSGDTLFKIAKAHGVEGGWEQVYDDNREVVGDNPNLIYPDQQLSLSGSGQAQPSGDTGSQAPAPEKAPAQQSDSGNAEAPEAPETPAQDAEAQDSGSEQDDSGGFQAPVDSGTSTAYGASGSSWSSGSHTGVDFSASSGTPVKAVTDGQVVSAGWSGSYGNEVVIQHADGKYSQYAHLSSLSVSAGQSVNAGDQLGLSGSTGNSTGPHLHFEVRTGPDYGSDIDPVAYLQENGVTL
ncbi:transglycosylase family protein [Streptomyces oceani]|uniref:Peptidase n=1 Tax=Streptomyces oceani TaxID=1075402 RepID=A0A1E7KFJ4_9ACTN|nr:transglycosylase family protein [Streptomyces oceani]OEV02676.1 peptidase [Streptomyces oceani]